MTQNKVMLPFSRNKRSCLFSTSIAFFLSTEASFFIIVVRNHLEKRMLHFKSDEREPLHPRRKSLSCMKSLILYDSTEVPGHHPGPLCSPLLSSTPTSRSAGQKGLLIADSQQRRKARVWQQVLAVPLIMSSFKIKTENDRKQEEKKPIWMNKSFGNGIYIYILILCL